MYRPKYDGQGWQLDTYCVNGVKQFRLYRDMQRENQFLAGIRWVLRAEQPGLKAFNLRCVSIFIEKLRRVRRP